MGAFLSILKSDAKIILRDVKALLLLLVMPVLVIGIFATALGPMLEKNAFIEPFSIAVVDRENSVDRHPGFPAEEPGHPRQYIQDGRGWGKKADRRKQDRCSHCHTGKHYRQH